MIAEAGNAGLTRLESHIRFAADIIEKYDWEPQTRQELTERLAAIRRKQADQALNLSVIGEFSSGKSTFINALLRMDLLAAGALQGTTVASTVLEYGPKCRIQVEHQSGKRETLEPEGLGQLRKQLNGLVSENDDARHFANVTVQVPSRPLRRGGFRIIDTPGLDATEQWHEEVTIRTLQETSDLSIILVDAVRPLPDSLCSFILEHLQPVLDRCVFVVTKLDMIVPREREMLLRYVSQAAKAKFEMRSPLVLPYSSMEIINHLAPGTYPDLRYEQHPEVSLATEKRLMEHMARQRTVVQTQKLLDLTDRIYQVIGQRMQDLTAGYEERLALLKRTRQADLTGFIAQQKKDSAAQFDRQMEQVRPALMDALKGLPEQAIDQIFETVDKQTTTDLLDGYVKNQLQADCQTQADWMCARAGEIVRKRGDAEKAYHQVLNEYKVAFQAKFRQLECLVPQTGFDMSPATKITALNAGKVSAASNYTTEAVNRENRRALGGIAAGAAVGSVIPGVGTLIGAAVGFVAGIFFSPDISELKKQTKEKLKDPLNQYFGNLLKDLQGQIQRHIEQTRSQISVEIDRYLVTYQHTVDQWIREEQEKRAHLETKVQNIKVDMFQIDLRRSSLESIRASL